MSPPDRLPLRLGEVYSPPGQPFTNEYWWRRSDSGRNSSTEVPLNANPYLWVSADMDVTPGTDRSNGVTG